MYRINGLYNYIIYFISITYCSKKHSNMVLVSVASGLQCFSGFTREQKTKWLTKITECMLENSRSWLINICVPFGFYCIIQQWCFTANVVINQSIKFLKRQYPQRSQAQWRNSQISVQIQSRWGYSITSTGRWAHQSLQDCEQILLGKVQHPKALLDT